MLIMWNLEEGNAFKKKDEKAIMEANMNPFQVKLE